MIVLNGYVQVSPKKSSGILEGTSNEYKVIDIDQDDPQAALIGLKDTIVALDECVNRVFINGEIAYFIKTTDVLAVIDGYRKDPESGEA